MNKSVSFIFSYESYLKAIIPIAEYFIDNGYKVNLYLYLLGNGTKQVKNLEAIEKQFKTKISSFKELKEINISDDKAVFFGLGGNDLRKLINQFKLACKDSPETRPLSISLYSGIRAPLQYDGFIARLESDIILFNNQPDLDEYHFFCNSMEIKPENGMLFGIPMLKKANKNSNPEIRKVTFIEQTIYPRSLVKRHYLVTRLIEYANQFQDRELTILIRDPSSNISAHKSKYPIDQILHELKKDGIIIPPNLTISTEGLSKVLKTTDLCITISSTVSLEAISLGIKTAIISDFGFSPSLGNCGHINSGYVSSFHDLIKDKIPKGNDSWVTENIITIEKALPKLLNKIEGDNKPSYLNSDLNQRLIEFDEFENEFKSKDLKRKAYFNTLKIYKKFKNKYKYYINKLKIS